MQGALDRLWPYAGEAFAGDAVDAAMAEAGIAPAPDALRPAFDEKVQSVMDEATLTIPEGGVVQSGGRTGRRHSEHLGHLLAQMQWLQRAYPGATW
jgi:ring-1,2-phenylacetyl-CoA epoxidase subunit PaaC